VFVIILPVDGGSARLFYFIVVEHKSRIFPFFSFTHLSKKREKKKRERERERERERKKEKRERERETRFKIEDAPTMQKLSSS
tara:strand:- start:1580 stop:1828 length:249 start_codon:yes stop_codon:yes gene_type:complete